MFIYVDVCVQAMCMPVPEDNLKSVRFSGAGVTGVCEPPHMSAGIWTVLSENSQQALLTTQTSL